MKIAKSFISLILAICFTFPAAVYANNSSLSLEALTKIQNIGLALLKETGTKIYLDRERKKDFIPSKVNLYSVLRLKLYVVPTYNKEFNRDLAFSQELKLSDDGELSLSIEILDQKEGKLVPFPLRAFKRIVLNGMDSKSIQSNAKDAMNSALEIVKINLGITQTKANIFQKLAKHLMNTLFPSAEATQHSPWAGTIMLVFGILLAIFSIGYLYCFVKNQTSRSRLYNVTLGALTGAASYLLIYYGVGFINGTETE